jgi:PRC-barrel domain protein
MTPSIQPEISPHPLIGSDRVEGTDVRRPNGDRVGTIQRIMIDKISGQVAYAILKFGGILGLGEKHLPIPWAKLTYDPTLAAYSVDISDDELAKAPSYAADKEFDWGNRDEEGRLHDYYRTKPYWGI